MSFLEVGLRPQRGVIGMGMIKPDNVEATVACVSLSSDQFARIDAIAIVGRVDARVGAANRSL